MNAYRTKIFHEEELEEAASLLSAGHLIAFPTETVYGLGASVGSEEAIQNIFLVKGRPSDNPLIVHLADLCDVERVAARLPDSFDRLAERFFPGPLTLVVPKTDFVSKIVSGGLDTVAIRIPSHETARRLIRLTGLPVAAPSANLSGRPSATRVSHVLDDFRGKIAGVVAGGPSALGIESTVLDLSGSVPRILRPGSITVEELEEVLGCRLGANPRPGERALSPGMKYRHYAPNAPVRLFSSGSELEAYRLLHPDHQALILSNEPIFKGGDVRPFSSDSFYSLLRLSDQMEVREVLIVCDQEVRGDSGLMNRIEKAAGVL